MSSPRTDHPLVARNTESLPLPQARSTAVLVPTPLPMADSIAPIDLSRNAFGRQSLVDGEREDDIGNGGDPSATATMHTAEYWADEIVDEAVSASSRVLATTAMRHCRPRSRGGRAQRRFSSRPRGIHVARSAWPELNSSSVLTSTIPSNSIAVFFWDEIQLFNSDR